jgi:hypothetical protein
MKPLTSQDVQNMIQSFFDRNYRNGNPKVEPHHHNGIDNFKINASDINGSVGVGLSGMQIFTSSGTFTPPSGVTNFLVECWGAGAGGYGVASGLTSNTGGGGGAYCQSVLEITGATVVTIGAAGTGGASGGANAGTNGGNTTFGSLTAGGGQGSGAGGTATGGTLNIPGGNGTIGWTGFTTNTTTRGGMGGMGGASFGGAGATSPVVFSSSAAGNNATFYGAGGSGATSGTGGAGQPGGNGMGGLVVITW